MRAVKANREYQITEADVSSFAKEGYDIYDENGALVRHGAGKTVTFEKYAQLLSNYEKLMAENAELTDKLAKLEAKKPRRTKKVEESKAVEEPKEEE